MASQETVPPKPETIERHRHAVYPPIAMLAGMQLDLFTPLKDGPMSVESLAAVLGVSPVKLRPLLYLLVTAQLLTVADDLFANTPEADYYLVRGRLGYLGDMHQLLSDLYRATLSTAESIRTGVPQARHDFAAMSEAELGAFFRGLHPGALAAGQQLATALDFSCYRRLLDAAGGSAGLAIAACEACPGLQATVAELPSVTPITQRFVAEAGMTDRVRVIAANLADGSPEGTFDVAVLRHFIQVLSADQARQAIRHVGRALEPGGVIHVVGYVLDDNRQAPPEAAAFNLVFLNIYDDGQAYTEQAYRDWLTEAGFVDVERTYLSAGHSVVTARKAE